MNPFSLLNADRDNMREILDMRWEHAQVLFTMKTLRLSPFLREFREAYHARMGSRHLAFAFFCTSFPTLPAWIGGHRLGHIPEPLDTYNKAVFPVWLKDFTSLPFVEPYLEFLETLGKEARLKPVALVFPRRGFKNGLVVHNGAVEMFVPDGHTCYFRRKSKGIPVDLVVQPYLGFLKSIAGLGWSPDPETTF